MDFTSEIITQLSQFLKFIFLIKRIACVHGLWYTGTGKYTQQGGICMDFKDLEYFAAIARCGNITRAAQQLYVSQPTLSKFLQKLEGDTGLVLFQRAGRRLELTYAGQRYLAHAERLLSQKREMDAELTDLLRADTGVLHVGMPPFRCSFSLPEVLPAFRAQFPQVQFRIEEAPSAELDRKLLEGEIDLAFYMSFARHPGLSYRVLRRDRMYAVFGKGHPLEQAAAREGSFAWEWLEGQTLLLQNQTQRQGQYILQELRSRRLHPAEILESSNIRAAAELAANGYGIGFLSGELLEHLNNAVPFNAFPLRDCTLPLESVAAWRAGNYLPRYALAFIERMEQQENQKCNNSATKAH